MDLNVVVHDSEETCKIFSFPFMGDACLETSRLLKQGPDAVDNINFGNLLELSLQRVGLFDVGKIGLLFCEEPSQSTITTRIQDQNCFIPLPCW